MNKKQLADASGWVIVTDYHVFIITLSPAYAKASSGKHYQISKLAH
jgi:hypothetical protein